MNINKKRNEKNEATFSIVFSMIIRCLRKDGINRSSLRIRIKRKVLSTLSPLDEVSELAEPLNELSLRITSYMLIKTMMASKIL